LLRSLIPSWRFFTSSAPRARLFFRLLHRHESSPWREPGLPPPRRAWNLFVNPHENLWLARAAVLEEFASDLADLAERAGVCAESLASYACIEALVRAQMAANALPGDQFQFGVAVDEDAPTWISAILEWDARS